MSMISPALEVSQLSVSIVGDEGVADVLDGVNLHIPAGRIVGVVGESGSGKTTLVKTVLGILPRSAQIRSGSISLAGRDLLAMDQRELTRSVRGKNIGFIPQDPYLALNPSFKIGTQLTEVARRNARTEKRNAKRSNESPSKRLIEMLRLVQIADPELALDRYPHEFSGGQRQRLLIAAALMNTPSLVVADEPTTALDVTTQFQILKLLRRLAREFNLSMLFVTHDFGVVAQLCDDVSVLYAGQSVECGPSRTIIENPRHPYTKMLIECHPDRDVLMRGIPGSVPSPLSAPVGCRFHTRCPDAVAVCRSQRPSPISDERGTVACTLYNGARGGKTDA
jgi:peptide/nickel transport system ATP-binding protein